MNRLLSIFALFVLYLVLLGNAQAIPDIDIEKLTNGVDADAASDAVVIAPGDPITWEYIITNTGTEDLVDIVVFDDQLGSIPLIQNTLNPGESVIAIALGIALDLNGDIYVNLATATGVGTEGDNPATVSDEDPSHYRNPTSTIPEPTTLALMGIGLAGLGYRRRKVKVA